ncbi:MAG: D-aminoacylase [Nitrospirae bacterium]|jgi:N-acyl-D-amino-acid deacylase|nr:D-aminoacylase [Nitrospirota bacterium]
MKHIDIFIANGLIIDGSLSEPFEGCIAISGDKISFIIKKNSAKNIFNADNFIDAEGMVISPGFIDTHAHSEFTLLADPRAEAKVCQGITTEINGNCGLSAAPLYGEAFEHRESDLKEYCIKERWHDFNEYFMLLKNREPALNFLSLTGHGNIRASVIGYKNKKPDSLEMKKMQELLRKSFTEGSAGLSTGLIYPPGVYSDTEELIDLLNNSDVNSSKTGIYTSHIRSEGDHLIEAVEELIRIGEKTGVPVHISHIKTNGKENWHKIDDVISLIENARNNKIKITGDRYPYIASSTDLDTILPSWAYEGGAKEELKRLKDSKIVKVLKQQIIDRHPEPEYWENITVSSVVSEKNKWMEGKTISHIANSRKLNPLDALIELLVEEKIRVGAIFTAMNEDNLKRFLSLPYIMIGTDSSARSFSGITFRGNPHPRGFGSFPKFVGKYVRDKSIMELKEAIFKITSLPSETFGLQNRGLIKEGFYADIVIFDYKKIHDNATFEKPFLKPSGIQYVFINGKPVLYEGKITGIRPGRILKPIPKRLENKNN